MGGRTRRHQQTRPRARARRRTWPRAAIRGSERSCRQDAGRADARKGGPCLDMEDKTARIAKCAGAYRRVSAAIVAAHALARYATVIFLAADGFLPNQRDTGPSSDPGACR